MTHDPNSVDAVLAEIAANDGFSGKGRAGKCAMVLADEVRRLRDLTSTQLDGLTQTVAELKRFCATVEAEQAADAAADVALFDAIQHTQQGLKLIRIHAAAIANLTFDVALRSLHNRADAIVDHADAAMQLMVDIGAAAAEPERKDTDA